MAGPTTTKHSTTMPTLSRNFTDASLVTSPQHLASRAHWIRNTLDLQIAQSGPEALSANDLLDIDSFLRSLLSYAGGLSLATLRSSRIHLAVLEICGRATRWPLKVIERAEAIGDVWENRYGALSEIGWDVRVEGWNEIVGNRESTVLRGLNMGKARKFGDLGFKPGDWWISTLFAFNAGILDSSNPNGGIVADSKGAYAVLLTDGDEILSPTADKIVYRARDSDKGRYRLTAATIDSRHPVRILRSHSLHSFWSPRAGVRYEGLYKIVSWSIVSDTATGRMVYDVTFQRLADQSNMDDVLQRPWAEEVEDYERYKRFKRDAREKRHEAARRIVENQPSVLPSGSDGTADAQLFYSDKRDSAWEAYEDQNAESPKGSVVVLPTRKLRAGD